MRLSPAEIHSCVSEAVSRLQEDGGLFRRFVDSHKLDRVEFWLATASATLRAAPRRVTFPRSGHIHPYRNTRMRSMRW
jgi:hypothetical protein